MAGSKVTVVLDNVESHSFIFKYLWTSQEDRKCPLNILDTIIFKDGKPYRWLFTSSKSGEVMKKKTENLWTDEIVSTLKNKAKALRNHRTRDTISYIATIWFIESDMSIKNFHISEEHLRRLLDSGPAEEVLAIQTYSGGWPLKASGVFEHQVTRDKNEQLNFDTKELLYSPIDDQVTIYADDLRKLVIVEQQHEMIKTASKRIVRHIERATNATITSFVSQVVFTSSWSPIFTAFRSVILRQAPAVFYTSRDAMVFHGGKPPVPAPLRGPSRSIINKQLQQQEHDRRDLLSRDPIKLAFVETAMGAGSERGWSAAAPNNAERRSSVVDPDTGSEAAATTTAATTFPGLRGRTNADAHKTPKVNIDVESKQHDSDVGDRYVQKKHDTTSIAITVATGTRSPRSRSSTATGMLAAAKLSPKSGRISMSASSSSGKRHRQRDSGAVSGAMAENGNQREEDILDSVLSKKAVATNEDEVLSAIRRSSADDLPRIPDFPPPRWDLLENNKNNEDTNNTNNNKKKTTAARHRPSSANATTSHSHYSSRAKKDHQLMAELIDRDYNIRPVAIREFDPRATSSSSSSDKLLITTAIATTGGGNVAGSPAADAATNIGSSLINNRKNTTAAAEEQQPKHLLATEASKFRSSYYANQIKPAEEEPLVLRKFVPKIANNRPSSAPPTSVSRWSRPRSAVSASGAGAAAAAAVSSPVADYQPGRHGVEQGGVRASGLQRPLPTSSGNVCYGDHCHFGKGDALGRQIALSATKKIQMQRSARGEVVCPYQLPFKSVLLERTEAKYLNTSMDSDADVQFQLRHQISEADEILATYAREQLERVAKKCRADIRDVLFVAGIQYGNTNSEWDDLNAGYRRMVYAEALRSVHPSRFYYTVPMCEVCYKLYTQMDLQRDEIVFMKPSHHPPAAASGNGGVDGKAVVDEVEGEKSPSRGQHHQHQKSAVAVVAVVASSSGGGGSRPSIAAVSATGDAMLPRTRPTSSPISRIKSSADHTNTTNRDINNSVTTNNHNNSSNNNDQDQQQRQQHDFSSSKFRNALRDKAMSARLLTQIEQQPSASTIVAASGPSPTNKASSKTAAGGGGVSLAEAAVAIAASAAMMIASLSVPPVPVPGMSPKKSTATATAPAHRQTSGLRGARGGAGGALHLGEASRTISIDDTEVRHHDRVADVSHDDGNDDPWNDAISSDGDTKTESSSARAAPVRFSKVASSVNGRPLSSRPHGTISSWVKLLTTANNASIDATKEERKREKKEKAAAKKRAREAARDGDEREEIRLFDHDHDHGYTGQSSPRNGDSEQQQQQQQQSSSGRRRPQSASLSPREKRRDGADVASAVGSGTWGSGVAKLPAHRPQPPSRPRSATTTNSRNRSPAFANRIDITDSAAAAGVRREDAEYGTAIVASSYHSDHTRGEIAYGEDRDDNDNNLHEGDAGENRHSRYNERGDRGRRGGGERGGGGGGDYFADDDLDYGDVENNGIKDYGYSDSYSTSGMPFTAAPLFPLEGNNDYNSSSRRKASQPAAPTASSIQRPPRPNSKKVNATNTLWPPASTEDITAIMAELWPDHVAAAGGSDAVGVRAAAAGADDEQQEEEQEQQDINNISSGQSINTGRVTDNTSIFEGGSRNNSDGAAAFENEEDVDGNDGIATAAAGVGVSVDGYVASNRNTSDSKVVTTDLAGLSINTADDSNASEEELEFDYITTLSPSPGHGATATSTTTSLL